MCCNRLIKNRVSLKYPFLWEEGTWPERTERMHNMRIAIATDSTSGICPEEAKHMIYWGVAY